MQGYTRTGVLTKNFVLTMPKYWVIIRMKKVIFVNLEMIQELLLAGEGLDIEFKQSKRQLNKDVFESVCAFLNRND